MRKLIVILLCLASSASHSQCSKILIGPYAAFHGFYSGIKIPLLFHQPPDATQTLAGNQAAQYKGKKYPVIIDFHGQGEITTSFPSSVSSVTTADLDDLYSNGMPQYVRTSTSAYVGKRYAAPGRTDSTQFFYAFPQTWQGYANPSPVAVPAITYYVIQWIKANYSNIIDTTKIYITGLSLGGFQVLFSMQFPEISKDVAAFIEQCAGGLTVGGFTPAYNFKNIAEDWGGMGIFAHSINDPVTDKNPSTGSGAWYTQRAIDSINKYKNKTVTMSIRIYTDATHNVWDRLENPVNKNNSYAEANGNSIVHSIPFQSLLLPWSTKGRRKP
jgi:hypothetical protein